MINHTPLAVIIISAIVVIATMTLVINSSTIALNLLNSTAPISDASREVKYELRLFHYWLKERVEHNPSLKQEDIWQHLNQARRYANVLFAVGENPKRILKPTEGEELRTMSANILGLMIQLEEAALIRLGETPHALVESNEVPDFDSIFIEILKTTNDIDTVIQDAMAAKIRQFEQRVYIVRTVILLVGLAGGLLFFLYERRRNATIKLLLEGKEKLRREQTLLAEAQAMAHVGNWDLDPVSMKALWSDEVFHILGVERREDVGVEYLSSFLHPDDREAVLASLREAVAGNHKHQMEYRIVRPDGTIRWLKCQAEQALDELGTLISLRGVVQDITEQKTSDMALRRAQKMDAIGQLTGGIAHDFNNLLGIILGNLELCQRRMVNDNANLKSIHAIQKAAERAVELTKQLLGFSRSKPAQQSVTNINLLVKEMDSLISRSVTPQINVEYHFAGDLWLTRIDPGDFEDTLLNLSINARDAMHDHGHLTIETRNSTLDESYCSQHPGATPGDYVQLAVSDNGEGIPLKQQERIFEPFFTTKEQGKGTGLGLSMVFGFIKRSEGYINVYSEPGMGTIFRLYLPRAQDNDVSQGRARRAATESLPTGTETILVVDDEPALVELARESLEALGYRVFTATDGRQALQRLAETPAVDLLFSDIVMPGGINGYELAEQATTREPALKVLLTSGYTSKAMAQNGQARFNSYLLSKPYNQHELANQIRAVLDNRQDR
jgi:PAS domain S-box-containing protein